MPSVSRLDVKHQNLKLKIMSKRKNFMLSPHFSYEEMTHSAWAEKHGVDNTPDELQLAGLINLCWKLGEPLRSVFGPIRVNSGFRCAEPLPGCFSPFPHGTGSLSVTREYLGLGDGPPRFRRDFSCLAVLRILLGLKTISNTRLLLSLAYLPR